MGTISIETSEMLSGLLKKNGIKHNVLNAKYHEKEAEIVAQAGKFGAVTVPPIWPAVVPISYLRQSRISRKTGNEKDGYHEELILHL